MVKKWRIHDTLFGRRVRSYRNAALPSLRAQRSKPAVVSRRGSIASSQGLLAMTGGGAKAYSEFVVDLFKASVARAGEVIDLGPIDRLLLDEYTQRIALYEPHAYSVV
jgi:hypothetical protein